MKHKMLFLLLSATLAGCAAAQGDRVLLREYAGHNYCHMKIETESLDPGSTDRDVVDFYGPCDEVSDSRDERVAHRRYDRYNGYREHNENY